MAYLFIVQEKTVFPNPETLLIEPFKTIWNRDKTKDKSVALEELAYIEFVTSFQKSNPFKEYSEELKEQKVREEVITKKNWKPDRLVKKGIEKVKQFQQEASLSYNYYLANKIALEKTIHFFTNELDYGITNKSGTPVHKAKDVTSTVKEASAVLESVTKLKTKVEEELFEKTKNKGNKEISVFAKR